MLELTDEQILAVNDSGESPLEIVNPRTHQKFVILAWDAFQRLSELDYDDSPSTREEREALGWEIAERSGWDENSEENTP